MPCATVVRAACGWRWRAAATASCWRSRTTAAARRRQWKATGWPACANACRRPAAASSCVPHRARASWCGRRCRRETLEMVPRIALADDQALVRRGLAALLAGLGIEVAVEAEDGAGLLDALH